MTVRPVIIAQPPRHRLEEALREQYKAAKQERARAMDALVQAWIENAELRLENAQLREALSGGNGNPGKDGQRGGIPGRVPSTGESSGDGNWAHGVLGPDLARVGTRLYGPVPGADDPSC